MSTQIRIDGTMVLAVLAIAGAGYLYYKRKKIVEAVDPTSQKNLANQAFNKATGSYFASKTGVADETYGTYCASHPDELKCAPFKLAHSIFGE